MYDARVTQAQAEIDAEDEAVIAENELRDMIYHDIKKPVQLKAICTVNQLLRDKYMHKGFELVQMLKDQTEQLKHDCKKVFWLDLLGHMAGGDSMQANDASDVAANVADQAVKEMAELDLIRVFTEKCKEREL